MHPSSFAAVMICLGLVGVPAPLTAQTTQADSLRPPAITAEETPHIPAELADRLRQYQSVRSAAFSGWAPDGSGILVSTRFGDTSQLHRVYVPGGRREQLTFFSEPVSGRFIPLARDGACLVTMSRGGSENDQVYLFDPQNGKAALHTDGKSRNLVGAFHPAGVGVTVLSNQRNGRDSDIYIADPRRPGSRELLLEVENEHWNPVDWSSDGKTLLLIKYVSINESYPALFHVGSRTLEPIALPESRQAAVGAAQFSTDGSAVYLACDARGEFRQLARYDLATREYIWLTADLPWDVSEVAIDRRSSKIAFTVNADGASELYLLEGTNRRPIDLPLGTLTGLEFSPDGKQLGFTLARSDQPTDAYSYHLLNGELTRWTFSEVGGLNPKSFVTAQPLRFPSFDGREIPAYLFRPSGAAADHKVPVLIDIHGGPESQYRPVFNGMDQYFCQELGIAVIHPNVRGSAGYGRSYLLLDNGNHREDSVRDIGALLDWIATQPELDASRVAVMGGSYGGYMVLASLVNFGERLRAGIDIVGIASFRSFLKNTSAYRQDLRRVEYGDERDPAMQQYFERIDPLANASRIRSALLVAHGRNDPRVPFSEAEQIVSRVRSTGRNVWTVYADNEGHGFAKKPNRDYLTAVIALFLQSTLIR